MKIKVEVDLTDFYSEEEESLSMSEEIKSYVAYQVKCQVLTDFREKINKDFNEKLVEAIEKEKEAQINGIIKEIILTEKVRKRYHSDELITTAEYVKDELKRTVLNQNEINHHVNSEKSKLEKDIKKQVKNISAELKDRYDFLFASQIVTKLSENGMLNKDVAKLLLDSKIKE